MSQFPILFVNGDVTVDKCMCALIENSGGLPDLQEELQRSYDSYVQDPPVPNDFRCQTPVVYVLSVCSTDLTPINIGKVHTIAEQHERRVTRYNAGTTEKTQKFKEFQVKSKQNSTTE